MYIVFSQQASTCHTHTHTPSPTQEHFTIPAYMPKQMDIHSNMRTILVDWLIEVQENFELFHETLYLAVKLVDLYLSKKEVKREYLQLVGATAMLIASKFEVYHLHDPVRILSVSVSHGVLLPDHRSSARH